MLLAAWPSMAAAGGWQDPLGNPHKDYTQHTSKCKVCHAVHEAESAPPDSQANGETLLRDSVASVCDYCHVGGPFLSVTQIYDSNPANYQAETGYEHTLVSGVTTIPDSGDPAGEADPSNDHTVTDFHCITCHSIHGAATVPGTSVLRVDPLGNGGSASDLTSFCADCHDNNYVTVYDTGAAGTDQSSHYMGVATKGLSSINARNCVSCHSGGAIGNPANSFSHMTYGMFFLKNAFDGNDGSDDLDGVCIDCHDQVGIGF